MAKIPVIPSPESSGVPSWLKNWTDKVLSWWTARDPTQAGDPLDKFVDRRSLVEAGLLTISGSGTVTAGGGIVGPPGPPGLPGAGAEAPDLTAPVSPTGFAAFPGITSVLFTWDAPSYTTGHGHARTNLYGAIWVTGESEPTFGDPRTKLIDSVVGPGSVHTFASQPATRWCFWLTFVSVDGVESATPAGGVHGVQATTGQDVTALLQVLTEAAEVPSSPYSRIGYRADLFFIGPELDFLQTATPTGTSPGQVWKHSGTGDIKTWDGTSWVAFSSLMPFVVNTAPQTINGVSVPPGVYMDAAFIKDGTITSAKIGNASIDNAKISSLTAAKITGGSMQIGSWIESTNYTAGASGDGWRINADGTAYLQAAYIRGQLTASQINSNGLSIYDSSGNLILSAGATPHLNPALTVGSGGLALGDLAAGTAQLMTLSSTGFAFVFADGAATTPYIPASITFTANLQNVSGTVDFTATAYNAAGSSLGAVAITETSPTATMTAAHFTTYAGTRYIVVEAAIAGTSGTLTDTTTIYRGDDGSDAVQAAMSNEAHTLPTTSAGVVDYTGSGTTIRVFEGVNELDYDGVGTANGKWTASRAVTTGTVSAPGAITESGLTAVVAQHAGMSTDAATITYTITGKTSTGAAFSFAKVQSLAKSKSGTDSTVWTVRATPDAITRTKTGGFVPNAIVFEVFSTSGDAGPALDSAYYSFYKGTGTTSYSWAAPINGTGSTYNGQFNLGTSLNSTHTALRFEAYADAGRTQLLDSLIVPILLEGADAVSSVMSNEAHVFPASATGAVSSYTGSGTTLRVHEGATALTYDGAGTNNGTWTFSTATTNITRGTITGSGTTTATIGQHIGVADGTDTASIVYTITGKTQNGTALSLTKTQTFSKSKQGTTGSTGSTGAAGTRGSLDLYRSGSSPLTTVEADAEILAQTGSATKVLGDTVTEYNGTNYVSVLRWNGSAWAAPTVTIDGSLLVTGTVTAAKLQANTITAASGVIADLAVKTVMLEGEAVTIPKGSTTTTPVTVTGTSEATATQVHSLAYTVGAGTTPTGFQLVVGGVALDNTGPGNTGVGVLIIERTLAAIPAPLVAVPFYFTDNQNQVVSVPVMDSFTLTAGAAYTYRLRLYKLSGTGTLRTMGATIAVVGTKK